ncbi:hypothetical protein AND_009938 [Anopheles darlingi]|uniref:Uncharacterized protein n=1 Tax=Anopheles darlingi TaxID=43151 RepID=W5J4Z5_ANODA|nr:hypothetical protein AND_009938 [Anopheles darlingi]
MMPGIYWITSHPPPDVSRLRAGSFSGGSSASAAIANETLSGCIVRERCQNGAIPRHRRGMARRQWIVGRESNIQFPVPCSAIGRRRGPKRLKECLTEFLAFHTSATDLTGLAAAPRHEADEGLHRAGCESGQTSSSTPRSHET